MPSDCVNHTITQHALLGDVVCWTMHALKKHSHPLQAYLDTDNDTVGVETVVPVGHAFAM